MNAQMTFYRSVFNLKDLPLSGLPEICFSGRSNVGKSSMINRLANRRHLAKTSQKPGKTRSLNYYHVDAGYYFVDLPGYGYTKIPKSERRQFDDLVTPYLERRVELIGMIQLIDARHGPVAGDNAMLDWIKNWDGKVLYVFTKVDKLSARERAQMKKTSEKEFGVENIAFFSARTGMGADVIWSWVMRTVGLDTI